MPLDCYQRPLVLVAQELASRKALVPLSLCLPYTLQHAHDRHTQRHHHTRTQKAETHKDLMSGGLSGEHERAETQAQMHKMQQDLEGAYHKANRMEDELDAARMHLKEQTHLRTVAEAQAATAMEQSDILDVALQKVALPLPAATLTWLIFLVPLVAHALQFRRDTCVSLCVAQALVSACWGMYWARQGADGGEQHTLYTHNRWRHHKANWCRRTRI